MIFYKIFLTFVGRYRLYTPSPPPKYLKEIVPRCPSKSPLLVVNDVGYLMLPLHSSTDIPSPYVACDRRSIARCQVCHVGGEGVREDVIVCDRGRGPRGCDVTLLDVFRTYET